MLAIKAVGIGAASAIVAFLLYLVVVVLMPLAIAVLDSMVYDGGGIAGASVSLELGILVAFVGFLLGFGWTLLQGRAGTQAPQ